MLGGAVATSSDYGMGSRDVLKCTGQQVKNVATYVKKQRVDRIVVCLGSGMTAAGILHGMKKYRVHKPLILIAAVGTSNKRRFYECGRQEVAGEKGKVSPRGFEPLTFGSGGQ